MAARLEKPAPPPITEPHLRGSFGADMLEITIASRKLALGVRYHKLVVLIKTMELLLFGRLRLCESFKPLRNPTLLAVAD